MSKESKPESLRQLRNKESPNRKTEDEEVTIDTVTLYDGDGEGMTFELLGSIEHSGQTYYFLTPFLDEPMLDFSPNVPADVFIMMKVITESGEAMMEPLEDRCLMEEVYGVFKAMSADKYDFATET